MNIKPRSYGKSLETVIVMSSSAPLFHDHLNRRDDVKNYIYIHGEKAQLKPTQKIYFDVIIAHNFSQDFQVLLDICKKYITDPQKTRIINISDCTALESAKLREHFKIEGKKVNELLQFHDKVQCKKILTNKIRIPLYISPDLQKCKNNIQSVIEEAENHIKNYPMFLKPIDSVGSTDLFKADNQDQLKKAIQFYVQKNSKFEVDEFLSGTLMEIDTVIVDNQIKFFVCWENLCDFANMFKGINCGQIMLHHEHPLYKRLFKNLQDIISAYGNIPDDVLDVETWHTPNDEIVLQELQLRRPGNHVPTCIENITGINLETISIDLNQGKQVRLPKDDFKTKWKEYGAWIEYQPKTGKKIKNINQYPESLKSQEITDPCDAYYRSACGIFSNTDWDQLYKDWKMMQNWDPYVYE